MKYILAPIALAAAGAFAYTITPGPWDLYVGSRKISPHPTEEACAQAAEARGPGTYGCRTITRVVVPKPAPPAPPPPPPPPPPAPPPPPPPPMGDMPVIDRSKIPAPVAGSSALRVGTTSEQARDSDVGAFRTVCDFSHMNFDDSIVYPGQVGTSHLHTYFGNTGSNGRSTPESLRTTGNSTCLGGIANRSSYWVPSMVADGTPIPARVIVIYYKSGYNNIPASSIQPLPPGLRMISGDAKSVGPRPRYSWERPPEVFECEGTGVKSETIPACPPNSEMIMAVSFDQCWDGVNLDSPDHKSHLSAKNEGRCPSSHPVALPEITFNVRWPTGSKGAANWRLSSDNYPYTGTNAGYSAHADWFNGWQKEISDRWTRGCVNARKDCHAHLLGDGGTLN